MIDAASKWSAHRPRVGTTVTYKPYANQAVEVGEIVRVEGSLCWTRYDNGEAVPFIWCFNDTLNILHDWPGKNI